MSEPAILDPGVKDIDDEANASDEAANCDNEIHL
ncbi:hypothetical protein predicted by Glimmer/Critica [Lactiplantibacillus plantarum]|nr:hypothetical protein predicted by Glimmer/Critica [Lactiplantibacillus plantarum]